MRATVIVGAEAPGGTFADGSLFARIREAVLTMESEILPVGLVRVRKPRVLVLGGNDSCTNTKPHLHIGFLAGPIDMEVP